MGAFCKGLWYNPGVGGIAQSLCGIMAVSVLAHWGGFVIYG